MQTTSKDTSDGDPAPLDERIERIVYGLPALHIGPGEPHLQLTLQTLMDLFKVPGISVAVVDNFQIAWAKGFGVADVITAAPVMPHTMFQAGSVSKPVAAVGALRLVESGLLSLDEDVNRRLSSWKVHENEFTTREKVTLRRLLSHTAGLPVHFFPGYSSDGPVPTLAQILNGEAPANTAPVRVVAEPGEQWRYSDGGLIVMQQLMIDAAQKPFPQILEEAVFARLGMDDSTFEQPLPAARADDAAGGNLWNGQAVRGRWHVYPEMAAGGLWTSATDLAKFAIEIARSRQGRSNRVLSQRMSEEMLTPQKARVEELALGDARHRDRMGLGFFLGDETRPDLFGHIGDTEGFQTMLMMFGESGKGAAILTNSQNGILVGDCLLEIIARENGWEKFVRPERPRLAAAAGVALIAQRRGAQAAIGKYRELKNQDSSPHIPDRDTLLLLAYSLLMSNRSAEAVEVLNLQLVDYPNYWRGYDTLAEVSLMMGDRNQAIRNYRKCVELNPENPHAAATLKKLEEQIG